ncbi:MAG TPA: hypothetical protein VKA84_15745 [Gemmatimonadaceae bacterium]|nr:hypothetical protein [Gemmatimonadaceae bacterium]
MKRLALVAAVLATVACTTKKDEPAADTAAAGLAPAPAGTSTATDTGAMAGMKHDSAGMASDSARKADSAKMAAPKKTP